MPKEAFANLWTTIKAGRPWDGLVKNRAKSGKLLLGAGECHPVVKDGEVTGYISIRSKPTRAQIDRAPNASMPTFVPAPPKASRWPTAS